MESIVNIIIMIASAFTLSWFLNERLEPEEIQVLSNGEITTYMYHKKWDYSCPAYCGVDHIHFTSDSLYQKRLKNFKKR